VQNLKQIRVGDVGLNKILDDLTRNDPEGEEEV